VVVVVVAMVKVVVVVCACVGSRGGSGRGVLVVKVVVVVDGGWECRWWQWLGAGGSGAVQVVWQLLLSLIGHFLNLRAAGNHLPGPGTQEVMQLRLQAPLSLAHASTSNAALRRTNCMQHMQKPYLRRRFTSPQIVGFKSRVGTRLANMSLVTFFKISRVLSSLVSFAWSCSAATITPS
jgi:hypothetical protein